MKSLLSPFVLLLGAFACKSPQPADSVADASPSPVEPAQPEGSYGTAEGEHFRVTWRPEPQPVPLNEPFEIELRLFQPGPDGAPMPGAQMVIDAWMPAHLHGMLRRPEVQDLGGGHYRAKGMLFHMRGHWVLRFDVFDAEGRRQRATSDVHLP